MSVTPHSGGYCCAQTCSGSQMQKVLVQGERRANVAARGTTALGSGEAAEGNEVTPKAIGSLSKLQVVWKGYP